MIEQMCSDAHSITLTSPLYYDNCFQANLSFLFLMQVYE